MKKILYSESQKFPSWMSIMIFIVTGIFPIWAFIQQILFKKPFGDDPMSDTGIYILLLLPVLFPLFFSLFKLELKITNDEFSYRMLPFKRKFITLKIEEIDKMEIVPPSVLKKFGGRGVKITSKGKLYFIKGKDGLAIRKNDGKNIIFSINKPLELEKIISKIKEGKDAR